VRQSRAETPPLSRFERDIPNFQGTPDLQTGQLAEQPCPYVHASFRGRDDSLLESQEVSMQPCQSGEAPGEIYASILSGRIIRGTERDKVFEANFPLPHIFVQLQDAPPHEWRAGQCLAQTQVSAFHSTGQVDLRLTVEQTYRSHFFQVHSYRIVRGGRLLCVFLVFLKI
jgi:hypothetical protein